MIWRKLYSALWYAATPFVMAYLLKRSYRQPEYRQHWCERFAYRFPRERPTRVIWIHAVSVGETRAAAPLIHALRRAWPEASLLVTQMTPTGREVAHTLFGKIAQIRYLPYDYPGAVQRFLHWAQPQFGILMETELWPNLLHAAKHNGIPLFVVNARLSEKSLHGYQKINRLIRPALADLTGIVAQTADDAQRLRVLGAQDIEVLGNIKFDCTPPVDVAECAAQFKAWIGARHILVAASTREGEEALLLDALPADFNGLFILVPRHPQRFDHVAALLTARGIRFQRRSEACVLNADTQVWLGDSMGELFAYYSAAEVAFIGGSLLPLGGQNLIEAAAVGTPVLIGPSRYNFTEVTKLALACGAARQITDANSVFSVAQELFTDKETRLIMRQAGLKFSVAHRGATARIIDYIQQHR